MAQEKDQIKKDQKGSRIKKRIRIRKDSFLKSSSSAAGEFKVLSQTAHETFEEDIREAIDTERVECKRETYSEIFNKIFRTG